MTKKSKKTLPAFDLLADAARDRQAAELQQTNLRLLRQLERAKANSTDLVEAVYQAAKDAVSTMSLPKRTAEPTPPRTNKTPEVAAIVLSDWQLAKRTPSYSSAVCEQRIEILADKIEKLTAIERADHPVDELRVWALGDIVEGELIFPGQAHQIDASLYRQVCVDAPRILTNFLRRMLSIFPKIKFVGVIGNHGALGGKSRRDYNPETNADRMLYRILRTMFDCMGEQRVKWEIPDGANERNWYAVDAVGAVRFLLCHGDQFRGGGHGGLPWYGFQKKINAWAAGVIPGGFEHVMVGHWHQLAKMPLAYRYCWVNGSTESHNTYAQEEMAGAGRPSQLMLMVHPKHGVTSERPIWLDHAN